MAEVVLRSSIHFYETPHSKTLIAKHQKRLTLYSCHFKEVRLVISEGKKRCFVGGFSSRNSLFINFYRLSRLGAHFAPTTLGKQWMVCGIQRAELARLTKMQYQLSLTSPFIFLIHYSFDRTIPIPNNNIQSWPPIYSSEHFELL